MRSVSFICAILVILLAGAITFHRLGDASIRLDSDEVIHARVTQEMHQSGAYFAPTHGGYPYWQKPPLSMWMSTAALRLFGENNFGFRAGSAVCGFALFLLIPLLSQRLFGGSPLPGVIAILVLLGSRTLILGEHGIRTATPDASLLLLTVAAMLCIWSALAAPATASLALSWLGVGVFTGLAVYSKSVVGFLPLCVMVALAALPKSVTGIARERIVLRNVVVACFLGIAIPAT
ncbi:MAG: glycosyltransferase family 39 protein [Deltaproteobacteria bacterium]|nr:glycosyltransferase family 39 protein [Deltaproteobacteria bacterium]